MDTLFFHRSVRIKQLQEFLKSDHWLWRYFILSSGVFYFEPPCILLLLLFFFHLDWQMFVMRVDWVVIVIWRRVCTSSPVASLRLVLPGAVTDGVTLDLFLVVVLKTDALFVIILHSTVTTRTLSAFPRDYFSSVLVNLAAKNYTFIWVSPPGWCHPGQSAPTLLVMPLIFT